jgi:dTDP-4-amino-4,6-dideoxy-D-galactose acyltransferase
MADCTIINAKATYFLEQLGIQNMNRFQILEWDSNFFGISIAQILLNELSVEELGQIISQMKREKVKLAYWASNPNDEESQIAARLFQGFLADKKVTFVMDISQISDQADSFNWVIEEYSDTLPCADLEDLSIQAGICSRFKRDSRIPEKKFVDLYLLWIRNSVNRLMADSVLVARQSGNIVGMVTTGEKNGRGSIGLLAVNVDMRGKTLGVALVRAAQAWARAKGLRFAQVITQGENITSCNLYEKCGYKVEKIEHFYHFWI